MDIQILETRANLFLRERDRFKKEASKLAVFLKEKGFSNEFLMRSLGMSRGTFYERLKYGTWKTEEVFTIIELVKEKETGKK